MLESHYLKTTLVIAPDIQFSPLVLEKVKCEHCDLVGKLKSCGWSDKYRYCHGIKSGDKIKFTLYIRIHESTSSIKGFYLLQRQYKCNNCQSKVSAVEVIQREVPEYVKVSYPLMFAGETIVHADLGRMILADVVSAKTMDEIGNFIRYSRYTEYTRLRLHYYSIKSNSVFDAAIKDFSAFEDKDGFNELSQPTVTFIRDFFVGYINACINIIEAYNKSIIPHPVISFDSTFHIQKRTKVSKLILHYIFIILSLKTTYELVLNNILIHNY